MKARAGLQPAHSGGAEAEQSGAGNNAQVGGSEHIRRNPSGHCYLSLPEGALQQGFHGTRGKDLNME